MKIYLSIAFMLLLTSCSTRKTEYQKDMFVAKENYNYKYDLPKSEKERIITGVIDSLNSNDFKIPNIMNDIYLDYKFNDMFVTYGKAISTRKFIINRVINIQALKTMQLSNNKSYIEIPNSEIIKTAYKDFVYKMPSINLSLKELIEQRIEALEN